MGIYGGAHFVDIPNIFPDFRADENAPAIYDFTLIDDRITVVKLNSHTLIAITLERE